jgi:carbonic anhydrase
MPDPFNQESSAERQRHAGDPSQMAIGDRATCRGNDFANGDNQPDAISTARRRNLTKSGQDERSLHTSSRSIERGIPMKRFNQAMVVIMGVAASTLLAQALASASREPAAAQEKHWAYEDSAKTVGPAKWGTLAGDATCSTGKQQSPITLRAGMATPQDLPNLVFAYKPSSLSVTNNGHTEQMTYEAGSTLGRVGTKDRWTLTQFHFHDPSEHTVDGTSYPLEMHLVHLDAAGKPAVVVAVFIQAGKENVALAPAFQSLPAKEGDTVARPGETIDAAALLPADRTFFTYAGSLTTPPCTEGITWYVLKVPIEMSRAQIAAFTKLEHLRHNNRPIQSLGGRVVLIDSTPDK